MRIIGGKHRGTKLFTLDGFDTRPTLDRVKEPLFSIINFLLEDAIVLDLFSGSGAIGLEALSRGARKAILCDNSKKAINIIGKNVEKVKEESNAKILNMDFSSAIDYIEKSGEKVDIVFLDPPYETGFACLACGKIVEKKLLNKDGIIIIETDRENEILEDLKKLKNMEVYDKRKYGRVHLLFIQLLDADID